MLRSRRFSAGPKDLNRSAWKLNVGREKRERCVKTLKLLLLLRLIRRAHVLVAQIP
jgi:hypothetical protein